MFLCVSSNLLMSRRVFHSLVVQGVYTITRTSAENDSSKNKTLFGNPLISAPTYNCVRELALVRGIDTFVGQEQQKSAY